MRFAKLFLLAAVSSVLAAGAGHAVTTENGTARTANTVVQWGNRESSIISANITTKLGRPMKLTCKNAAGCLILIEASAAIQSQGTLTVSNRT
jgi:hypothetical protein